MKPTTTLLAASSLVALLSPTAAQAKEGILSFDPPTPLRVEQAEVSVATAAVEGVDTGDRPLPIPPTAANPPMRYHSPQQLPAGVYRRGVAVALNARTTAGQLLPPPPPLAEASRAVPPPPAPVIAQPDPPAPAPELTFALEPSPAVVAARAQVVEPVASNPLPALFEGQSDSLVAWAVGSAEGTRTPNGGINRAYFGHTDPGNRAWNMGTFSYQHGAKTPEEADKRQLIRLQNQGEVLRRRALRHGMNLTLEETLNGLDLANQSPLAAIGRVGYIERLAEAKANGYEGAAAIVQARTRSYINPKTGRWNAPGLGNTEPSIRRDQQRRADAVAQAIAAYTAQNDTLQASTWRLSPSPSTTATGAEGDVASKEPVDAVLSMWTTSGDPPRPDPDAVAAASAVDLADASAEESAALEAAEEARRGIADLWQISLDRASAIARTRLSSPSPQMATLAARVLDVDLPSSSADPSSAEAGAPYSSGDISAPPSLDSPGAQPPEPPPDAASAFATPAASPAWAEVREGHQATLPVHRAAVDMGAVPDSTVYRPQADHSQLPREAAIEPSEAIPSPSNVLADDDPPETATSDQPASSPDPNEAVTSDQSVLEFASEVEPLDSTAPGAAIAVPETQQEAQEEAGGGQPHLHHADLQVPNTQQEAQEETSGQMTDF